MKIGAMNHPGKDPYGEITWIAENDFDFVDFTYEPPASIKSESGKVINLLKENNLFAVGHTNPTLPAIYPLPGIKEICIEEIRKSVAFFKEIGVKKMNIHPFFYGGYRLEEEKIKANIEILKEIEPICHGQQIDLMLENYITPFDTPRIFERIIEAVPNLKIHLDIGHCNIGHNVYEMVDWFYKHFEERIIHLHIHDNQGKMDEHLPLGCGNIDWKKIIKILKDHGYNNTATLEVFSRDKDYLVISKDKLVKYWKETSS
jgi:sugar phosphate isomerase/epimerase